MSEPSAKRNPIPASEPDLFDWGKEKEAARARASLDDICFNYHGGNPESMEANRFTNKARDAGRIITELLDRSEGLTCDELEVALKMRHQTCSARCSELKRARVIIPKPLAEPNGAKYHRRLTRTGRPAAVLIIKNPNLFTP